MGEKIDGKLAFTVAAFPLVRDAEGSRLFVVGTHREPFTRHEKVNPTFHAFCASILALHPSAVRIETIQWYRGVDVEQAPVLLIASRTENAGQLAYSIPPHPPEPDPNQDQQQQREPATKPESE